MFRDLTATYYCALRYARFDCLCRIVESGEVND
jgi:hypothetical protein